MLGDSQKHEPINVSKRGGGESVRAYGHLSDEKIEKKKKVKMILCCSGEYF